MFKRFITKSNLKGLQNVLYKLICSLDIQVYVVCTYVNSEFSTCYDTYLSGFQC